jgi:iron(III) transport system ATP-binding protein
LISVTDLKREFATEQSRSSGRIRVTAVDGVDFVVPEGKLFSLVGPSGCGKTTTMRCIAGLDSADHGEIVIDGVTVYSSRDRINTAPNRRRIGMVFQSYAIWPHMTVRENVAYPLSAQGVGKVERRRRVMEALELVGLEGQADRPAPRLSGGQQQRVALARALVANPKVLLLDEPLSNLDAKLRTQMRSEIKALQRNTGITTLYVTHDQQEAMSMSDELAVLSNGKITQQGTPDDIYFRPRDKFTAAFVGSTNLLEATLLGASDKRSGSHTVSTPVGSLCAQAVDGAIDDGDRVLVSVRPEVIEIEAAAKPDLAADWPASSNKFLGRVVSQTFLGDLVETEVRVGETLLKVKSLARRQPSAAGTDVVLTLPSQHCRLVIDEDPPAPDTAVA